MNRQQLEQEAITCLERGNHQGALKAYSTLLKGDPRDRRVRQKVGDLLVKLGRPREAEPHYREVLGALQKEGNFRAAVAVAKQLHAVRPEDPALHFEMAELHVASGFMNDARVHFDQASRLWGQQRQFAEAARAAARLADLSPGEPMHRVRAGELLENAGDTAGAMGAWMVASEEYRRRGRLDEVGRLAEHLVRLDPAALGPRLDAAAARLDVGDARAALQHLQQAYENDPRGLRTLELLARAFEAVGQTEHASRILLDLAEVAGEKADPVVEAEALQRAIRLAPENDEIAGRLARAEDRRSRFERRITTLRFAAPDDEADLRPIVRAEVQARYGFADRAEATLRAALVERETSLPLLAALGEFCAAAGRKPEARGVMEQIVPRAGDEAESVWERIVLLGGARPAVPVARRAPVLRAQVEVDEPTETDFPTETSYAEVSPDLIHEASGPGDDIFSQARRHLAAADFDAALVLMEGRESLLGRLLTALAHKGMGRRSVAIDILRQATNEASDNDIAYPESLFELASLYAESGKARSAIRLLEEIHELAPDWKADEVEALLAELRAR